MTPTKEEAELAAAIFVSEGFEEDEEIGAAEIALRMRGALKGFAEAPTVRDRYCLQARALRAAGYVKRNDALEEAAKVADGVQGEFKAEHDRHGWIANKLCAQAAHVVAARIRALKAKT